MCRLQSITFVALRVFIFQSVFFFCTTKLPAWPASLVLSERLAWPSYLVKHDTKQNTHTHRCTKCTPSWKAAASQSTCQAEDNLLCEGSSRQRKDYSPPISIKHTGNTLRGHVQWWWQWWRSEFNALWLLFWVLIWRIHIILLYTLEMNDSLCDMFPEHSLLPPAFPLRLQP